jgi:FkbM family methyltransferase
MKSVRDFAKTMFRSIARAGGYDIVKWHRVPPAAAARKRLLDSFGIDVVLDVGANSGLFATSLRDPMGYRGAIISFEPLPDAFRDLAALAAKDPRWDARNVALGATDGHLTLNVSRNRVSSSFLPIRETSTAVEPNSAYESECIVPVRALDSILPELNTIRASSRIMLKLDTQGFESQVLAGAAESLARLSLIQMEMSLVTLYDGELLFLDMCGKMREQGFELLALDPGFHDVASGRLLQVDGLFARTDNRYDSVR